VDHPLSVLDISWLPAALASDTRDQLPATVVTSLAYATMSSAADAMPAAPQRTIATHAHATRRIRLLLLIGIVESVMGCRASWARVVPEKAVVFSC
jgi:hypothetical protein